MAVGDGLSNAANSFSFANPFKKKKNRMPSVSVSAINNLTHGFNFIVRMNGFTYGFQEVSNIEIENKVETIYEGGVNDHPLILGKPDDQEKTLQFKRGLILRASSLIADSAKMGAAQIPSNIARRTALVGINALDPQESLESGPSYGVIEVYNRYAELTGMYNFISVGLKSWKLDTLSATNNDILYEEITIFHTGIKRVPLTISPPIFQSYSYQNEQEAFDSEAASERWKQAEENKKLDEENRSKALEESEDKEKTKNISKEDTLNPETQNMLNEANSILGEDGFNEFSDNLKGLLNNQSSIEERLSKLKEEKQELKKEIDDYYSKERETKRKEELERIREEQAKRRAEAEEAKRIAEQERREKLAKEREELEKQRAERERLREEQNNILRQQENERQAKRKEELEKIREEQAKRRAEAEEEKRNLAQRRQSETQENSPEQRNE